MAGRDTIYIFHIFRQDGTSLFLHPLTNADKVVAQLEKHHLEGRYGKEPRVEALTMFRNELYRQVELGVRSWLSDMRFIPKFLIAAAVFVLGYFFTSFVIRDPVPVIDELVVALVLAVVVFVAQGKRDMSSKLASKKRLDLRVVVDRTTFQKSAFVGQVEEALHRHEGGSIQEVVQQIVEPARQELGEAFREEAAQFITLLESRFDFRKLQREEKVLRRLLRSATDKDFSRMLAAKKYDFPLYAVYKSFKKTVSGPR
jgi:hypothetical protein